MSSPPNKPRNKDRRDRESLTGSEIEQIMVAAKKTGRYGHRNATMILLAFRHGLRVSELIALRWSQLNLKESQFHVTCLKNGFNTTHPLFGPEIRAWFKQG